MQCLRCGRKIEDEEVFCFLCEAVMVKQPVKPNTVVSIPDRNARPRPAPSRKPARPEEDTSGLRRTILQLRLWVCMLLTLLVLCAAALTWQELHRESKPAIGQNYTSITDSTPAGE